MFSTQHDYAYDNQHVKHVTHVHHVCHIPHATSTTTYMDTYIHNEAHRVWSVCVCMHEKLFVFHVHLVD